MEETATLLTYNLFGIMIIIIFLKKFYVKIY